MVHVRFTQNIQRHVPCPPADVDGATVSEVLDGYFRAHPMARGYVLDDRGALRHHMVIFVNNGPLRDKRTLSDAVTPDTTIDVMQALSGG